MIFCKELDQEFDSKESMYKSLREYKDKIISAKKAQIYKSFEKGISVKSKGLRLKDVVKESLKGKDSYFIVTNTTNVLDSHNDLHVKGVWNRTAKNQSGKNYLVDSHKMDINSTIARKEDIEIFVEKIPFSAIGSNLKGETEALIYKVPKDKIIHEKAREWLEKDYDIEASVRMQYVDIQLAMDSYDEENEEFKGVFDKNIENIANKEVFESENGDITHFWVVKEAKNIGESSLVLQGSNSQTGQIIVDSSKDTQQKEVALEQSRQEELKKYYLNKI